VKSVVLSSSDNVLALDLGVNMGWAIGSYKTGVSASGSFNLDGRRDSCKAMRWIRLDNTLTEISQIYDPYYVVYEQPGALRGHAAKVLPSIQAIIEFWCLRKGLEWTTMTPSAVKKHATGKGTAKKADMLQVAKGRWPTWTFERHDQVDAMWLLDGFFSRIVFSDVAGAGA
jgi:Holliday junction resolvasome RuvABC endonuclease subunit